MRVPGGATQGGGDHWGVTVRSDAHGPGLVVDGAVVVSAEQHKVVQRGDPAVRPVADVVGVGPARWAVTPGERAPAVPDDQRPPESGGIGAGLPSDVQWLTCAAKDRREDAAVTGDAAQLISGEQGAVEQLRGARLLPEVVEVDQDDELRLLPSRSRQITAGERSGGELDQCVGHPLEVGAVVPGGGRGVRPDGVDPRIRHPGVRVAAHGARAVGGRGCGTGLGERVQCGPNHGGVGGRQQKATTDRAVPFRADHQLTGAVRASLRPV